MRSVAADTTSTAFQLATPTSRTRGFAVTVRANKTYSCIPITLANLRPYCTQSTLAIIERMTTAFILLSSSSATYLSSLLFFFS